jgi:SNF2 family DNA or RNA helicase
LSYPYLIQPRPEQLKALKKIFRAKRVLVVGDMGVGKTKLGVDFIGNMVWHKKITRSLVIAPLEAIDVWIEQIGSNCPFLTYSLLMKGETVDWNANIILVNYDFVCPRRKKRKPTDRAQKKAALAGKKPKVKHFIDKKIIELIRKWSPEVVIADESHKIKRPTARRSKAIHTLGPIAEYTVALTGTPTGNKKVVDLWSQFRLIKPDLLDETFDEHKQRYGVWGGFGGFQLLKTRNVKELSNIIAPHTIRIKKTGLPEKNHIRYPVSLPQEARGIYKQMEEEFVAYVSGQNVIASIALTKMMKLSQIAGGFIKNEKKEDLPIHKAKVDALKSILENLRESGAERVVVFARFLWELDQILKVLKDLQWPNIHRVKGRVKQDVLDKFNQQGGAMVCQTQSGSGSNNFQAANYMIFYSTDYSLINFSQAIDRIHRLGQTKPCFYYFLQAKGTVDMRIYNLLQSNKDAAEELKTLIEEITDDHRRRS